MKKERQQELNKLLADAARQFGMPLVEMFHKQGAQINIHDGRGLTPLMEAAYGNETKAVEYLLDHGADIHARGIYSDAIMTSWEGESVLHVAASSGEAGEKCIRTLVCRGADLEALNLKGDTPLLRAARLQNKDAMLALIRAGANPDAVNEKENRGLAELCSSLYTDEINQAIRERKSFAHARTIKRGKPKNPACP